MNYGRSGADAYPGPEETTETVSSTGDDRVKASAVRHTYRVLSDEEKQAVDLIKTHGQTLIDSITRAQEDAIELLQAMLSNLDPSNREGAIALDRFAGGFGMDIDFETGMVSMITTRDMRIAIEETVMWSVKALTA
jgi:hypothetical protein